MAEKFINFHTLAEAVITKAIESNPMKNSVKSSIKIKSENPKLKKTGKWFYVPTIASDKNSPNESTHEVFSILKGLLSEENLSLTHLVSVTLLVKDMNDFLDINQAYISYFGINPPIRVCVEAPLEENVKIAMAAIGFKEAESDEGVPTMHVQSISHWAPANIGPYSQANMVDGILHIAGQIGLIPGSMELPDSLMIQTKLSMRHLRRILEVYVSTICRSLCTGDKLLFVVT